MDVDIKVEDTLPPARNVTPGCIIPDVTTVKEEREDILVDAIHDSGNSVFFFNECNEEERPIKIRRVDVNPTEDPLAIDSTTSYTSSPPLPSFNAPVLVKVENVELENEINGAGISTDFSIIAELTPRIKAEVVDVSEADIQPSAEHISALGSNVAFKTNIKGEEKSDVKEEAAEVGVESRLSYQSNEERNGESSQSVISCIKVNDKAGSEGFDEKDHVDPCSPGEEREPLNELQTSGTDCDSSPNESDAPAADNPKPFHNPPTADRPFPCPRCPAKFKFQDSLDIHLFVHAPKKLFPCKHCTSKLRTQDEWERHQILHEKGMRFKKVRTKFSCKVCSATFNKRALLNHHMKDHTKDHTESFPCIYCAAEFRTIREANRHVSSHLRQRVFLCPGCLTDFKTDRDLTSHLEKYKKDKEYFCKTSKELKTESSTGGDLNSFPDAQSIEKVFPCPSCPISFKTMSDLTMHMNIHTTNRVYPCTQCSAELKTANDLNAHMAGHRATRVSVKSFQCGDCRAEFKTISELDWHKAASQNGTIFLCSHCPLEFYSKCDLFNHQKVHTHDKVFSCTGCSLEFKTRYDLSNHLDTHLSDEHLKFKVNKAAQPADVKPTPDELVAPGERLVSENKKTKQVDERPFACPSCPATFKIKESLDIHAFIHKDQKMFSCQHCTARFKWKDNWKQHQMTHIYPRPFGCPHCPARLKTQEMLNTHMLKHTEKKPYSCLYCPAKFKWKDEWRDHQETHT